MFSAAKYGFRALVSNLKIFMILGVVSGVLWFLFSYGEGRAALAKNAMLEEAALESYEAAQDSAEALAYQRTVDTSEDALLTQAHDQNVLLRATIDNLMSELENEPDAERTTCALNCLVPWERVNRVKLD